MDKKKIRNLALVLLPLAAVVLAGLPDCVTVLNQEVTVRVSCSMFTLIEDVQWAVCLPLAGIFGAVTFGLAVLYLLLKKEFWLKAIMVTGFVSMSLSVVPVLLHSGTILIPNMLVPILLGVETMVAYAMAPRTKTEEEPQPKLLKRK